LQVASAVSAKGMQIIVCSAVHEEVRSEFQFKDRFAVKVKGKIEPQKVWLLNGNAQSASL